MHHNCRFITKHWQHHSAHSGYDQLVERLGSAIEPLNLNSLRAKWIPGRVAVALAARSGNDLYSYLAFYEEWAATRDMMLSRVPSVYHVLYGDETYRYLGSIGKSRSKRIVATYHLPPSALRKFIHTTDYLRKLDALIVVGRNQLPFFEPIVRSERLFFVPHGVDVHTFTPENATNPTRRANGMCLFVGIHRRDFYTLRRVIEAVTSRERHIRFTLVTSKANFQPFQGVKNVTLTADLPETELIKLYREADVLVQPLEDSTANNAILEGMACGLPTIATDIGAVRDYVDESCGVFTSPHNAEEMADAVLTLMANDALRVQMASQARLHALQYDWGVAAEKMKLIYSQVMSR